MTPQKQFNIRKKIAKHGENSIIVIPKLLQNELRPKMVVDIQIKIVEKAENEKLQDAQNMQDAQDLINNKENSKVEN